MSFKGAFLFFLKMHSRFEYGSLIILPVEQIRGSICCGIYSLAYQSKVPGAIF